MKQSQTDNTNLSICPYCGVSVRSDRFEKHTTSRCKKRPRPHPFADILPRQEVPTWLLDIVKKGKLPDLFPLKDVLQNSCYYPASGLDASPVIIANGFVHSFIYCDYGIKKDNYKNEIIAVGFKGYTKILQREVGKHEIAPMNWMPEILKYSDGNNDFDKPIYVPKNCEFFGDWTIWERTEEYSEEIGPKYFSLFFLTGECLATYQGLYLQNLLTPKIIAMIQPGHAYGNIWKIVQPEDVYANTCEVVKNNKNSDFLLIGRYGNREEQKKCPFKGYKHLKTTKTQEPNVMAEYICNESGQIVKPTLGAPQLTRTIDIYERYEE